MSSEKKLMMMMPGSFARSETSSRRNLARNTRLPSSNSTFPIQRRTSRLGKSFCKIRMVERREKEEKMAGIRGQVKRDVDIFRKFSHSTLCLKVLNNFVIFLAIFISLKTVESLPQENLNSKIKMFLDKHCQMLNATLEDNDYESFMTCGPSHGAGIVKNLGRIPEYKSEDTELWAKATKREIISQCDMWPQDRDCQETTFKLIEKCFEKDQKFIFYFMFALTDVICQSESDIFIRFWQSGGDSCLGNHIRSLKKDFSDCFVKTSTVSSADVYRNFDDIMQCFRSQFDNDCVGDGATEVLKEIMEEIRRVYQKTIVSSGSSKTVQPSLLPIFLLVASWITFLF